MAGHVFLRNYNCRSSISRTGDYCERTTTARQQWKFKINWHPPHVRPFVYNSSGRRYPVSLYGLIKSGNYLRLCRRVTGSLAMNIRIRFGRGACVKQMCTARYVERGTENLPPSVRLLFKQGPYYRVCGYNKITVSIFIYMYPVPLLQQRQLGSKLRKFGQGEQMSEWTDESEVEFQYKGESEYLRDWYHGCTYLVGFPTFEWE